MIVFSEFCYSRLPSLIERYDSYSPSIFRQRKQTKQETTSTNNFETFPGSPKFELPPGQVSDTFASRIRFAKGDFHIEEEEEDDDMIEKKMSEILISDSTDNKDNNGFPNHQHNLQLHKLDAMKANLFKANYRAASSTQDTPHSRENNRASRAHKLIRKIINSKKHSFSTIFYKLSFIVTMVVLLAFLVWLNYHTSATSKRVGSLGSVIHNAYFRNYWTKITCQDTIWVLILGGIDAVEAANRTYNSLIKANQDLEMSIGRLDLEFQDMFYQRNVGMYELNETGEHELIATDNSFQAIKRLYNVGLPSMLNPVWLDVDQFPYDKPTRFVLDNSLNDLLIVTEDRLEILKNNLFDTLVSSRHSMVIFLAVAMSVLGLFILHSLGYVIGLIMESGRCLDILFTIPQQQIATTELCLNTFKELLELDSEDLELLELINVSKSSSVKNDTHGNAKNNKKVYRKASIKKVYARNYIIFASLFVCLGLVVAFALIYHNQALDKLVVMEKQQMNSNAALDYLNTIGLLTASVPIMLLENSEINVRNKEIFPVFNETAQSIKEVTKLQNSLKNENGEYSPGQEEILFNFNCSNAHSAYHSWDPAVLIPECQYLSDGLGVVGLTQLLGKLDMVLSNWIVKYEAMDKDVYSLFFSFVDDYLAYGGISTLTDTIIVVLSHSYMASTEDFENSVKKTDDERVVLTWVASVVTLLLGAITYIFVVRRLSKTEFEKKELLALIPSKLIFENFLLRRYVVKISRGDAKEAEKLLSMK